MAETRKIAAILAADVVGFSRMANLDEDRTLSRLRALRAELIDPTVASLNGRIFKRTGDGVLVEFRSVVEAVRCAIALQSAMVERNVGLSAGQLIEFRIGIHLGDVVEESDGDLMGDGVNIAARLEGVAEPGAICLSSAAYEQVSQRLNIEVTDIGPVQLKNIGKPVRAYLLRVGAPARPETSPARRATKRYWNSARIIPLIAAAFALLAAIGAAVWRYDPTGYVAVLTSKPIVTAAPHLSIVVLPFTNLSNDPKQDYFSDAISENLTTELARVRDFFVIARNTAFTFKGRNIDAKAVGKELGVRYVLEGSVQREANKVRINVQLIDAETGAHLWADRFENDLADLLQLQDAIVSRLASSLSVMVAKIEARQGTRKGNPDAIDLTMRGIALLLQSTHEKDRATIKEAREALEHALRIDPDDANTIGDSALSYVLDFAYGSNDPAIDYNQRVLVQADKAIALDPGNMFAYTAKVLYLIYTHKLGEALNAAADGLQTNPNSPYLLGNHALASVFYGKYEQARVDSTQAIRLSPRDDFVGDWRFFLCSAEFGLGHLETAIEECDKAVEAGYRIYNVYRNLAALHALRGQLEEAHVALAEARQLNPKFSMEFALATAPRIPGLLDGLRKAGLSEK